MKVPEYQTQGEDGRLVVIDSRQFPDDENQVLLLARTPQALSIGVINFPQGFMTESSKIKEGDAVIVYMQPYINYVNVTDRKILVSDPLHPDKAGYRMFSLINEWDPVQSVSEIVIFQENAPYSHPQFMGIQRTYDMAEQLRKANQLTRVQNQGILLPVSDVVKTLS